MLSNDFDDLSGAPSMVPSEELSSHNSQDVVKFKSRIGMINKVKVNVILL